MSQVKQNIENEEDASATSVTNIDDDEKEEIIIERSDKSFRR